MLRKIRRNMSGHINLREHRGLRRLPGNRPKLTKHQRHIAKLSRRANRA